MPSNYPYLHQRGSETLMSLMSLVHLDPSPIDTPEDESSEDSPEASASGVISPSRRSPVSIGLSGTGRGPIFYFTRIQRYSSYTFTFFAGLHFANTAVIPLIYRSVPYSEPFLLMTRELYQTRYTEPLLVGLPVVAHILSGIAVRLLRRRENKRRYQGDADTGFWSLKKSDDPYPASRKPTSRIWPVFSNISASGYVLAIFLTSHVAMNRLLPLAVDGDSSNIGLAYVAHGFSRHAPSAYVAYAFLLTAGAGHMVWGMARWLDWAPPADWRKTTTDKATRRRRSRAWWAVNGTALTIAAVWAAGGLGVVARAGPAQGWLASVYDGIYEFAGR
ncbi:hypothetical protein SAMD00023353_3200690 [Rosellinia necatrix]|uniref:Mitochondrial adapter protein MCP1 transmembrane domain-containing protein n=1 Tax=Rosellinia necatrix TaxID=77044 RepID=A0A1W2TIL4_ROSNE|nr:hypothetical protein SAMD00023353_3200690 [Rosellinia necatrix]